MRNLILVAVAVCGVPAFGGDVFDEIAGPAPIVSEKADATSTQPPAIAPNPIFDLIQKIRGLSSEKEFIAHYVKLVREPLAELLGDDRRLLLAYLAVKMRMEYTSLAWLKETSSSRAIEAEILNLWRPLIDEARAENVRELLGPGSLGSRLVEFSGTKISAKPKDVYIQLWLGLLEDVQNDKLKTAVQTLRSNFLDPKGAGYLVIGADKINLNVGRILYQAGYLNEAKKYYDKVPRGSRRWASALEESAWTDIRNGEVARSLSKSKTLTNSFLLAHVNPDAFYLAAISSLKLCNYWEAKKALSGFRQVLEPRFQRAAKLGAELARLSPAKAYPVVRELRRTDQTEFDLTFLDSHFTRVDAIRGEISRQVAADHPLVRTTLAGWAEASLAKIRASSREYFNSAAQEIRDVARKMHVVEAEMMQQVMERRTFTGLEHNRAETIDNRSVDEWALVFPYEDEDNWFDELNSYQIKTAALCLTQLKGGNLGTTKSM